MLESTPKPNIVLITADQWRGDCLGCVGNRHPVMTPHMNQLAAEGVRFTRAYADCPVCMPQRVTLLTGQVASRFGLPHNFSQRSPVDVQSSLPARLAREAGYQTKGIGKMHLSPDRARMGFEHVSLHPNDYVNWLEETPYAGMYRGHGLGGNEVYPAVAPTPERFTHTHWIVDQAIRFLAERDPECPFFLWIVFESPHSPFDPPAPYDRMYDNFTIPNPVYGDWAEGADYPPDFIARRWTGKYDQLSAEMLLESRRRYYGQVSYIDYQLGRFFGELRSRGMYEDTAILFDADHGEHLGDHGIFGKTTFLRGSGDVPLLMRVPQWVPLAHPALEIETPVLTADLHPTILELAGLSPPPSGADGRSLLPWLKAGSGEARVICGEHGHGSGTAFSTDGQFKYIYYARGGIEHLFDVVNDPDDLHNLSHSPDHEIHLERLKAALIDYLERFDRPLIEDGQFIVQDADLDEYALRGRNPCAWRGPMRYGQGYGGGW
jgi:arylsulfatase A-like enzyme